MTDHRRERFGLGALIGVHIVACCLSLVTVAYHRIFDDLKLDKFDLKPDKFHIYFDPSRSYVAIAVVVVFAVVALLLVRARFSFGYFVGFYFFTMVLGYLWLNCFSGRNYDHGIGALSAAASAVVFLLPALFITSPLRQVFALTTKSFDWLLTCLLVLGIATIAIGAVYHFRLVALEDMNDYRAQLDTPIWVNYLLAVVSTALLPFALAGFVAIKAPWRAAAVLLLLLLFYPVTINKTALLTPLWLVFMLALSRIFEARVAVIVSLLAPVVIGLVLFALFGKLAAPYFDTVNFRMIAVPSVALDVYNDFFSRHDLTYFCQISFLKPLMHCPYQEQLAVVLKKEYDLGNFNASLFATEGIASLGTWFAPVAVFVGGLVIALGNRLSAGLPAAFILISGAMLPQTLLNVPLTTTLLTHGAALLFLLWYITPRGIFERDRLVNNPALPPR
jgi:uncharacterized membrane protein YidH (DUF202 family)